MQGCAKAPSEPHLHGRLYHFAIKVSRASVPRTRDPHAASVSSHERSQQHAVDPAFYLIDLALSLIDLALDLIDLALSLTDLALDLIDLALSLIHLALDLTYLALSLDQFQKCAAFA